MRTYCLFIVLALALHAGAQVAKKQALKPTDWYTLFSSLLPDERETEAAWKKTANPKVPAKWSAPYPKADNKGWYKSAKVKILADADGDNFDMDVVLYGKNSLGYAGFRTEALVPSVFEYKSDINSLLGASPFSAKLLEKKSADPGSSAFTYYVYELKLAEKKVVWVFLHQQWVGKLEEEDKQPLPMDHLEVYCFFDEAEYRARRNVEPDSLSNQSFFRVKDRGAKTVKDGKTKQKSAADEIPLSLAAKIIFKNETQQRRKNFFAEDIRVKSSTRDELLPAIDSIREFMPSVHIAIHPTDLNKDGTEEIFIRKASTFYFGPDEADLELYLKTKDGKYIHQEALSSAHWYVRATGFGGYPDMISDERGGPA